MHIHPANETKTAGSHKLPIGHYRRVLGQLAYFLKIAHFLRVLSGPEHLRAREEGPAQLCAFPVPQMFLGPKPFQTRLFSE